MAINSALLATIVGVLSTLLGLVLRARRAARRPALFRASLKLMSILPIVTPPFVIALALVVLFGRTGLVTGWLDAWFGIPRSRWIYGLPGVTIAQLLTFSPIAFMILYGALAAISPALEEAAQTLRASRGARVPHGDAGRCCGRRSPTRSCWASSRASPTSAIRSCSPATSTCCRPRSSSPSPARSTIPAARRRSPSVLLGLTLLAFWLQQRWIGRLSYVTVTGKGDGGLPAQAAAAACGTRASASRRRGSSSRSSCYVVIFIGGFVKDIGRGDMTPTFGHFLAGFGIDLDTKGRIFVGLGVEQPVHDDRGGGDRRAAHRDRRTARRLRDHAPPLRRAAARSSS